MLCCCWCWVSSVMSNSVHPHRQQPTRLCHPWDSPGKNTGAGCHFLLQCMKVKSEREVTQLCLTLRNPMDCSLPGSSVHEIFQARVLEWAAIAFSKKCSRRVHNQAWKSELPKEHLLGSPAEQLSPGSTAIESVLYSLTATTTEPTSHNNWSPHTLSPCSATREACIQQLERSSCSLQLQKSLRSNKDAGQPK